VRSIVEDDGGLSSCHLESLAIDFQDSSQDGMVDNIQNFRCAVCNLDCVGGSVGESEVGGLHESSGDIQDGGLIELKISSNAQDSANQNSGGFVDDHVSGDDDSVGTGESIGDELRSLGDEDISGGSDVSIDSGKGSLDDLESSKDRDLSRCDVSASNGEGGVLE